MPHPYGNAQKLSVDDFFLMIDRFLVNCFEHFQNKFFAQTFAFPL